MESTYFRNFPAQPRKCFFNRQMTQRENREATEIISETLILCVMDFSSALIPVNTGSGSIYFSGLTYYIAFPRRKYKSLLVREKIEFHARLTRCTYQNFRGSFEGRYSFWRKDIGLLFVSGKTVPWSSCLDDPNLKGLKLRWFSFPSGHKQISVSVRTEKGIASKSSRFPPSTMSYNICSNTPNKVCWSKPSAVNCS